MKKKIMSEYDIHNPSREIDLDKALRPLSFSDFGGQEKGVENLKASKEVKAAVVKFMAEGKIVAAICAAPTILAEMGILNGKTATVHPAHECYCSGAKLTHTKSARDGNLVTGQAVGGSFEFAFELIAALESPELARQTREGAAAGETHISVGNIIAFHSKTSLFSYLFALIIKWGKYN